MSGREVEQALAGGDGTILVWDPLVRVVHWTVAAGCLLNLFALETGDLHDWIGYVVTAAVVVRVVWGFVGPRYARFSDFVRGPGTVGIYILDNLRGRSSRFIGHNPAAAVMMLVLMALVIGTGVTGYLMGTDRFWGEEWLENLHIWIADAIMVLALVHAAAAIIESLRHRENLIWAMFTGRKRA